MQIGGYCSLCDNELIELWRVDRAVVLSESSSKGEVSVLIQRLQESSRRYGANQLLRGQSLRLVPFKDEGGRREWSFESLDLAYVYIQTKPGQWDCLGRLMGLRCEVKTPTLWLGLPADARSLAGPHAERGK